MLLRYITIMILVLVAGTSTLYAQRGAGQGRQGGPPPTPQANAPIDLTGTWVSVVTEDWQWRMVTPQKGDVASIPVNAEGRKIAMAWDLQKDVAASQQCRAFGVGGLIRIPGRIRISWQDGNTLKLEFDAGTQTRLMRFDRTQQPGARDWQGHSVAEWTDIAGGRAQEVNRVGEVENIGNNVRNGTLKAMTTNMLPGYLRKNGVPYSESMVLTEYFDRHNERDGSQWLTVTSIVEDPRYLNTPFVTSTSFKKEPDASKFRPTGCVVDPPGA
jgi:hypothetical protein